MKLTLIVLALMLLAACGAKPDQDPGATGAGNGNGNGNGNVAQTTDKTPNEESGFIGYVVSKEGGRILVVEPRRQDFSATGGISNYYAAIWFSNAPSDIEIGQKVNVRSTGPIAESYPAQGRADSVTVIAAEKPEGAVLTEAEAIRKALASPEIAKLEAPAPVVVEAVFDKAASVWTVTLAGSGDNANPVEIRVDDDRSSDTQPFETAELYRQALDAFIRIGGGLSDGMAYIAIDLSALSKPLTDQQIKLITASLDKYEVEVRMATLDLLEQSGLVDAETRSIEGILLRVERADIGEDRAVIEGSVYKSAKGAHGTKVILARKDGQWRLTDEAGTWIS